MWPQSDRLRVRAAGADGLGGQPGIALLKSRGTLHAVSLVGWFGLPDNMADPR